MSSNLSINTPLLGQNEANSNRKISFLESFIPRYVVYLPIIGEIVRPIFAKVIDNLQRKHTGSDQITQHKVKLIADYYKDIRDNSKIVKANKIFLLAAIVGAAVAAAIIFLKPIALLLILFVVMSIAAVSLCTKENKSTSSYG